MKISLRLKKSSANSYEDHGVVEYQTLPRTDEYISKQINNNNVYFQVTAVHHAENGTIELYAIQSEPAWEYKKSGSIGFSFK